MYSTVTAAATLAVALTLVVVRAPLAQPQTGAPGTPAVPARPTTTPAEPDPVRNGAPVHRKELLSQLYTVDKIYKSMQGPVSFERTTLGTGGDEPELVWMTGYRTDVTAPDGHTEASPEFMCHSAVDTSNQLYQRLFGTAMSLRGNRLFSVDQGTREQVLPVGFGIPIMSNQQLLVATQVLNHNVVGEPFQVRQRVRIDFVRHADLARPLIPLIQHGVYGMALVEGPDGHFGVAPGAADQATHGPGCSIADDMGDRRGAVMDSHGRRFSSFWSVEPGRHEYHTRVTSFISLPYDTTLHYAAGHLHPFAESIELFDLTADKSVCKLYARQSEGRIGLAGVDEFSSADGVPLYRDHEYDLISVYDNTSGVKQDAMATMLLYVRVRDVEFAADARENDGQPWHRVAPGPLSSP